MGFNAKHRPASSHPASGVGLLAVEHVQGVLDAVDGQKDLYPQEYATPVHPTEGGGAEIVESHSLIPDALRHAFSTFGALMSPDLPLERRQHEMIATMVSVTNRCVY